MKTIKAIVIYTPQFGDTESKLMEIEVPYCTQTLDKIFRMMNRVDGSEQEKYLEKYQVRSMCSGDLAGFNDKYFRCEMAGWKEISKDEFWKNAPSEEEWVKSLKVPMVINLSEIIVGLPSIQEDITEDSYRFFNERYPSDEIANVIGENQNADFDSDERKEFRTLQKRLRLLEDRYGKFSVVLDIY